ncbi:5-formyltetrahydrofolate cyclo-ligase [Actinomadura sp. HBU206391]|uniref:5-formyltetrahydrofolate cyclo-ligase n=1 Tax=Actinomadura sp. HBU206391 TaxID=2731692 RepID=UPI0016503FDF|nr:5-formyltetrahydrofolate cyclo-ligase [Actinomadura sp. HBU206391]MBC6460589.1 5-formyltetrahydrofolate cyclo-ligase [Actinomadura sp. HBU206391]
MHDPDRQAETSAGTTTGAALSVDAEKAAWRTSLLTARGLLSAEDRAAAARSIRDALLSRPEVEMAASVAAYASLLNEPDTRGLLFALWKRGTYVLLPRLLPDRDLDWATYEGPDSLVPGPHGLLQPTAEARGVRAVEAADVVIVPSLAVDRSGMRLGRGGGSYDRALARVGPQILTVGLVYDAELVDALPAAPHDRRLSAVVTPSGGFRRLP